MARVKLRELKTMGADAMVLCCPSCFLQFDNNQYLMEKEGERFGIPVLYFTDILDGKPERWAGSKHIWQCLECHHCLEICYQNYGFENAMTALRLYATKKGMHPQQVKRGWDMFIKTGRLGEPLLPARKKLNLPEPGKSGKDAFLKRLDLYMSRKKTR